VKKSGVDLSPNLKVCGRPTKVVEHLLNFQEFMVDWICCVWMIFVVNYV
jgi:hypothetical protein